MLKSKSTLTRYWCWREKPECEDATRGGFERKHIKCHNQNKFGFIKNHIHFLFVMYAGSFTASMKNTNLPVCKTKKGTLNTQCLKMTYTSRALSPASHLCIYYIYYMAAIHKPSQTNILWEFKDSFLLYAAGK